MEYQANITPNYIYNGSAGSYCTVGLVSGESLSVDDDIGSQQSYSIDFEFTQDDGGYCEFSGGTTSGYTYSWNSSCSPEQYANPDGLCIDNITANITVNWNPPTGCTDEDDCAYNSPANSDCVGDLDYCVHNSAYCEGAPSPAGCTSDNTCLSFCDDFDLQTCNCICNFYTSCGYGDCLTDQQRKRKQGTYCNSVCNDYHDDCGCAYTTSCNSGIDNVLIAEEDGLTEFVTGTSAVFEGSADNPVGAGGLSDEYDPYEINFYRIYLTSNAEGGLPDDNSGNIHTGMNHDSWVSVSPTIDLTASTTIYFTDDGTNTGTPLSAGTYYIFFDVADAVGNFNPTGNDGTNNLPITLIGAVSGCTDTEACNYDYTANTDDGSCDYAEDFTVTCYYDDDGDGILDSTQDFNFCPPSSAANESSCEDQGDYIGDPVIGCLDDSVINYNWSLSGEDVEYDDGKHCISASIFLSDTSYWERTLHVNLHDPFVQDSFQTGWDDNTNYVATSLNATVDWGDGSDTETIFFYSGVDQEFPYGTGIGAGNAYAFPTHTYETDGDYDITVNVGIVSPAYPLYQNTWSISLAEPPMGVNIVDGGSTPYSDEVVILDGIDSPILNLNGVYEDPGTPEEQITFQWTIRNPLGVNDTSVTTQNYGNYNFDIIGKYDVKFQVSDPIYTEDDEIDVIVRDPFFYQLDDFLDTPYTDPATNTEYDDLDHWLVTQGAGGADIETLLDGVLAEYGGEIGEPDIYNQIIRLENDYFNIIGFTLNPENSPYDFESIINNSLFADEDANEPVDWPIGSIIVVNYFDIDGTHTFVNTEYTEGVPFPCLGPLFLFCCNADGNPTPGEEGVACPAPDYWTLPFQFQSGQGLNIYIPAGSNFYLKWGVGE